MFLFIKKLISKYLLTPVIMVMTDFKAACIGIATLIAGATVLHSSGGCWGSRGQTAVYTTQYHGKQATVMLEDIILGQDQYKLLIEGKDASEAKKEYNCGLYLMNTCSMYTITDDHGKTIIVYKNSYSIK